MSGKEFCRRPVALRRFLEYRMAGNEAERKIKTFYANGGMRAVETIGTLEDVQKRVKEQNNRFVELALRESLMGQRHLTWSWIKYGLKHKQEIEEVVEKNRERSSGEEFIPVHVLSARGKNGSNGHKNTSFPLKEDVSIVVKR